MSMQPLIYGAPLRKRNNGKCPEMLTKGCWWRHGCCAPKWVNLDCFLSSTKFGALGFDCYTDLSVHVVQTRWATWNGGLRRFNKHPTHGGFGDDV